ncbi:DNA mismatch repair endonuclease MutL [Candidatus Bipolaricaulota bacterium]
MPIRRLEDSLTQKIAAGEVIERPASAVKELVENAIDAGSERIDVELQEGGARRITVRDDGEGMAEADLLLSVERYATSKIATEDDLDSIATLGFRGEALASIAAVSKARITSSERDSNKAHVLEVEAGGVKGISPAARGHGTTVEIRDLFYNVPARARFLGKPRTEFFHANRAIQRLALVCPEIGWSVSHDGRDVFSAAPAGELIERIGQIYGTDTACGMMPVDGERGDASIRGFVSHPDVRRGNRRDQIFIVNGRVVSDRGLSFVLASAYRGILRPGSYPIAVVCIDLPPADVDVNVHPRKEEVRFADPRRIQDALAASLHRALSGRLVVGSALPSRPRQGAGERVAEAEGAYATGTRPLALDLAATRGIAHSAREAEKVRVHGDRRVIGQLQSTYLLVETEEGLEIIDQHIAHERVLYERLANEVSDGGIARQIFLLPARVEVSFELASILTAHGADLERFGIVLDEFGGGTFLVREYPRMLADEQAGRGFQELMEGLGEDLEEALFDRIVTTMACGAAIKAGERIPLGEAQALVEKLMTLENPYFCPHGRPIIQAVSREELDRRFKRS